MDIYERADQIAENAVEDLAERRLGEMRSSVARLTTELSIIRGALPDPSRLIQIAAVMDRLLPEDPNPHMQEYLKIVAEQVSAIQTHSGIGQDAHTLLQDAIEYGDLVIEYRSAVATGAARGILVDITKQINAQVDKLVHGADNMRQYMTRPPKGDSDAGADRKENRRSS